MAKPNALVDIVIGLSPTTKTLEARPVQPPSRFASVSFQGGRSGILDMTMPRSVIWAGVLDSLRQENQPAYVEIDPETNVITEVLCPLTVNVGDLTPTHAGDAIQVELIISHARHYLRRANPDFQQLLNTLETAQKQKTSVLVTQTLNDHEIIDVRPLPNPSVEEALLEAPPVSPGPVAAPAPISWNRARQLFNLVNAKICCPASAASPCIPFLYPDDGCWGRAHEMCRLMILDGAEPRKVWIYGSLCAKTQNHPSCEVHWGWHVAPTLLVSIGLGTQVQVIDPSLFSGPVRQDVWKGVQGDPSATLEASDASVFHRTKGGTYVQYDPTYTKTNTVLTTYRNMLRLRSAGSDGPPPYINCLTKSPGVQWFGIIGPNATRRWYTWGWPASWHVVWTIMPITPCPGGSQLSWNVQVERASATHCTYWITVKNLTSDPVKFEGRYDILRY
jgi:hypothetical protein